MFSGVAQLVEQATVNRWVTGSSPVAGAICDENICQWNSRLFRKSFSRCIFKRYQDKKKFKDY